MEPYSLFDEVQYLKQQILDLQHEVHQLKSQIHKKSETEIHYQKHLEQKYGASHCKSAFGICDLETDNCIIEIKNWKQYKTAIGQLVAYTHQVPKTRVAYFFGTKPRNVTTVLDLFTRNNITVYHISTDDCGAIHEEKCTDIQCTDDFQAWLDAHIIYQEHAVLTLSSITNLYYGKMTGPRISSLFKKRIEEWIKSTHTNVLCTYTNSTYHGVKYKGWLHLSLVL